MSHEGEICSELILIVEQLETYRTDIKQFRQDIAELDAN